MSDFVSQRDVRDGGWDMFSIIQQRHNARIQTFQTATIMAILFADAASVFQITRPSQTQCTAFKVAIREHVRQTEGVVIFLCKRQREGENQ